MRKRVVDKKEEAVTMSMYVFAPAGPQNLHNEMMRIAVEYIGSQDSGFGSSWAKGKRYLKGKLGCSGTAVKRACVIKNKYINHDFEEYGAGVYYYQKDDCARIVKAVLEYMILYLKFSAIAISLTCSKKLMDTEFLKQNG